MHPVLRMIIGGVIGAGVGLFLHKVVGCRTGACPLYGNPYTAVIFWGILGVMVAAGR